MEVKLDRSTKLILVMILLALVANLLQPILMGRPARAENQYVITFSDQQPTFKLNPISIAAGEGDRIYYYDGANLWYSPNAGTTWKKIY